MLFQKQTSRTFREKLGTEKTEFSELAARNGYLGKSNESHIASRFVIFPEKRFGLTQFDPLEFE